MDYLLEVIAFNIGSVLLAQKSGAHRIELCDNPGEGGTTPSYGHIKKCRDAFDVLIYPIIRPRGGDFLFTSEEFDIMLQDVKLCKQLGCDGVVIGLLNKDGSIDKTRSAKLVEAAYPLGVTFHRAFDRCRDPFTALEELIEIGCERILTSGQQPAAPDALDLIAQLNKAADERIIIMPGSGVRKENIRQLAEQTGCVEFHSSLRGKTKSEMDFIHPSFAGSAEDYMNNAVNPQDVIDLRNALLS